MAVPTVSISSILIYGSDSAQGRGNVSSNGGKVLSSKGICWNTTGTPTTSDNTVSIAGTAIGTYSLSMLPLEANTKYYVRAYAINADGTGYSSEVNFTTLTLETPSLQNVFFEKRGDTPKAEVPKLKNVFFEKRGDTPKAEVPKLKNVFFEKRDPETPLPTTPKVRCVWFQWGMPDYERPMNFGNAILFGAGI